MSSRSLRPNVLFVCTGNLCRSPLSALLMERSFPSLAVTSAGTQAVVGAPMPERSLALAHETGLDGKHHRARQLTTGMITDAALVLALSREHRREVVTFVPRASRYTFTLREFGRIADSIDRDSIPVLDSFDALVALVAARRGRADRPSAPEDDDIVDPIDGPPALYRKSLDQTAPSIQAIVDFAKRANPGA